jgi:hypothetical protein
MARDRPAEPAGEPAGSAGSAGSAGWRSLLSRLRAGRGWRSIENPLSAWSSSPCLAAAQLGWLGRFQKSWLIFARQWIGPLDETTCAPNPPPDGGRWVDLGGSENPKNGRPFSASPSQGSAAAQVTASPAQPAGLPQPLPAGRRRQDPIHTAAHPYPL